jgi:hypothetical protein
VRVTISQAQIADPARVLRLQRDMLDRLATIAGVTDVSFTGNVPMAGERSRSTVVPEDAPIGDPRTQPPMRWFRYIAPGYFKTIGTRLIAGRDFTWVDLEDRRPVVVISENLARESWRAPGDVYRRSMATTSFALLMLAVAAAMALVLGTIGIYGVIAYAVTQRRREIGIRAALGASRGKLQTTFVRGGLMLALAGVAVGLSAAAALTRLMSSMRFGTSPLDPTTYALVSLGLVSVAALASYVPARGASRVDPVIAEAKRKR